MRGKRIEKFDGTTVECCVLLCRNDRKKGSVADTPLPYGSAMFMIESPF